MTILSVIFLCLGMFGIGVAVGISIACYIFNKDEDLEQAKERYSDAVKKYEKKAREWQQIADDYVHKGRFE